MRTRTKATGMHFLLALATLVKLRLRAVSYSRPAVGLLLLALLLVLAPQATPAARAAGSVIYVNKAASTGGDGATWGTAYKYLQDALAAANDGDEIWIAKGVYYPDEDEGGNVTDNEVVQFFEFKSGMGIYGGFSGSETSRDQADPDKNLTVLSGDIDQNDITNAYGVTESYQDINGSNAERVMLCYNLTERVTLDGVVLTGGSAGARSNGNQMNGAGLLAENCLITLNRVSVIGNQATDDFSYGGGAYIRVDADEFPPVTAGTTVIENSTFSANYAASGGGGSTVWQQTGTWLVKDTTFENNVTSPTPITCLEGLTGGGGVLTLIGSGTFDGVTFRNNETHCNGGGYHRAGSGNVIVSNSIFLGNQAKHWAGASDQNSGNGGAVRSDSFGGITLESSLLAGNHADIGGGGFSTFIRTDINNTTIVGNSAGFRGGAIYAGLGDNLLAIRNAVIYGNETGGAGKDVFTGEPAQTWISHSLVEGCGSTGTGWDPDCGVDQGGNIDAAPGFQNVVPNDPAASNYRLRLGSPAIDTGLNSAVTLTTDLDGNPRIFNSTVDMGAYEAQATCPPGGTTRLYVDAHASGAGLGTSWADALPSLQNALSLAQLCPSNSIAEIWVAQGTYYPDDGSFQTGGDRAAAFQLQNGLSIYGGFVGNETDLSQRNSWAYITTLSGDIGQDDHTDANDLVETPADIVGANSYHVVVASGTNSTARLDGFAVTGGQANGSPAARQHEGGALFAETGSPTLNNLALVGNIAEEGGAMTLVGGSNPTITNAWFGGNAAGDYGGALHNESSNPTLINVQMSGNRAVSGGGAIYNLASSPVLINVTIAGNAAGGTVSVASVSPAAVMIAPAGGGILNLTGSKPDIRNSIVWANQDSTGIGTGSASIRNLDVGSTPSADYSDIQGLTTISGLIYDGTSMDADPLFVTPVDPATAPAFTPALKLSALSPVIDKGNNAFNTLPTDLAGMARIQGAAIDMGAFETTPAPHIALHKSASTPVAKVGETITYTYQVVNTGLVTLTALSATDDKLGVVNFGVSQLAPSASATASLAYTVVEGDLPGPLTNRATVTGTSSLSGTVVATEAASVGLSYRPRLVVTVTPSALSALPGTTVTYAVQVKNTGDVSLSSVAATDNRLGTVTLNATTLAPGATASGTIAYTVQTSDLPGPLVDTVTGSGTSPLSTQVKGTDSTTVAVIDPNPPPAFDLYMPTIAKQ